MLKAYMIKRFGNASIYYKDNPNRTISLENCVERVFTNSKSPVRLNFTKIIELRNTSTHFITEEYEMVYVPLLQACVFNFVEKMKEFHDVDMSTVIPENFITLSVRINALDEEAIRGKYPEQIAERLIQTQKTIQPMIEENNSRFAIRIEHYYYQTKNKNEATEVYRLSKDADEPARIIKELRDPNETHKYNAKKCIEEIKKHLRQRGVTLLYHGEVKEFNKYHFQLFLDYYGLKENARYCFIYRVQTQPTYSYSQQLIDFIVEEIIKDPNQIIEHLKEGIKKANPGSKGF